MSDLLTTQQAAELLGRPYDVTRKLLRPFEPAQVIGRNRMWTREQVLAADGVTPVPAPVQQPRAANTPRIGPNRKSREVEPRLKKNK